MIKVLARSTNNAEQFCGQRKGGKFKCENFTKFFPGLHGSFSFHRTINISSFVVCFIICFIILFWQNNKYLVCVYICREAKLRAFVKMQITRNQPKPFQNRRIFRELKCVTSAELPSKSIRQTLVLTCSLRVESLHTLFAAAVDLLQSQLAVVTTEFYP